MALSTNTYTYAGGAQTFSVNFALGFIQRSDVKVRVNLAVDGSGDPVYTTFTWIDDSNISVTPTLTIGDSVQLERTVSKTELKVNFSATADVTPANLDLSAKHGLMVYQELVDGRIEGAESPATAADRAVAAAAAALVSEGLADADRIATNADVVLTNADVVSTNADVVLTNADAAATASDRIAVAADLVATNQDTIDTAADKVATNADVVLTNADVVLAEADKVQTGLDRIAVAADLVLTDADTTASAASAAAASTSAGEAAASAASITTVGSVLSSAPTGSAIMPTGTTAERDVAPADGYLRFNSTDSSFEGYNGSQWGSIGGGATGGGSDAVFYENGQTVTTSYTVTATTNAMTAGPITINAGATVTVDTGGRWVVL